jgi:hypothetical protein
MKSCGVVRVRSRAADRQRSIIGGRRQRSGSSVREVAASHGGSIAEAVRNAMCPRIPSMAYRARTSLRSGRPLTSPLNNYIVWWVC